MSVDALVGEPEMQPMHLADLSYLLDQPRRATPTVPPGLSAPVSRVGTPSNAPIRPPPGIPTPHAATPHAITPAVPDLPLPSSRSGTPARKNIKESERSKTTEVSTEASKTPTITKSIPGKVQSAVGTPITVKAVPEAKIETPKAGGDKAKGKAKVPDVDNAPVTPSKPAKEMQPSPVKTLSQIVASEPKVDSVPPSPLKTEQAFSAEPEAKSAISSTKRQHPGPLQIPKKDSLGSEGIISSATDTAAKNPRAMSITAESTSRPGTPTGATTGSPLKRTGPQIMRITNTPKAETPPAVSAFSAPATAVIPPSVVNIRSRQPSVASINPPGTPLSELISDNASMTSTSMSRANSPPPGTKVGSAPQRSKTKSQAKKERQERARQMTEVELGLKDTRTPSEEPVVEGIQTRKKKEKKAKPAKPAKTAVSTPSGSRTGTPGPPEKTPPVVETPQPEIVAAASPVAVEQEKPVEEVVVAAATPPAAAPAVVTEQPPPPNNNNNNNNNSSSSSSSSMNKPPVTPASIIAKLQAEGAITHEKLENMFKSFPLGPNERQMTLQDVPNRDRQYVLSDEAIKAVLERREAHRLGGEDGRISSRVLVTPEGTILRGLSREEEDRYLELEASLRKKSAPGQPAVKWNPTREPYFDLERIVRNLNVRCVVDKSNTLRQTQAALQKAAQQAAAAAAAAGVNASSGGGVNGAAAAAAAAKLFDEAANYNDEFIMPSSPTLPDDLLLPPPAVENADRTGGGGGGGSIVGGGLGGGGNSNLSASTSSTATTSLVSSQRSSSSGVNSSSSLLAAPFESHYIHVNGITLSDAAAPVLGIELGKSGGGGLFVPTTTVGAKGGVTPAAAAAIAAAKSGGPVLALPEIEKELNVEKQRANEFTKKLNAAIKRNRKVVGAAGH